MIGCTVFLPLVREDYPAAMDETGNTGLHKLFTLIFWARVCAPNSSRQTKITARLFFLEARCHCRGPALPRIAWRKSPRSLHRQEPITWTSPAFCFRAVKKMPFANASIKRGKPACRATHWLRLANSKMPCANGPGIFSAEFQAIGGYLLRVIQGCLCWKLPSN